MPLFPSQWSSAPDPPWLQVTGKCGSVTVRLIPAPRGAGIVAARTPKKVLQMAGIEDCYTVSRGSTKTLGNFVKVCPMAMLAQPLLACLWPLSGSQQQASIAYASITAAVADCH